MADFRKEDYDLELCACGNTGSVPGGRINLTRVRERLDALEEAGDTEGAVRLLDYWLEEAREIRDRVGETLIENEYVGLYRKAGRGEESLRHGERALSLLEEYGLENTVMAGTTRINVATACTAFDRPERGMALFEDAREIYEGALAPDDGRLGGLYNNMGLCAAGLGRFAEGRKLYEQALQAVARTRDGEGEAAMTCLNLADLVSAEAEGREDEDALIQAAEETERLVEKAWMLLNTPSLPHDSYYRFICDKCAPVMAHYGRLDYAEELEKRAKEGL